MLRSPLIKLRPISAHTHLVLARTGLLMMSASIPRGIVCITQNIFSEGGETVVDVQVMLRLLCMVSIF